MTTLRRFTLPAVLVLAVGLLGTGCSKELKIGAVISESGAVASYGDDVRKGMDLALEEINAAGGYQGADVSIIYKDDATNEARGKQVTLELIEQDEVTVIIGAISSAVTLAIAPICTEHEVVLLSPSASARSISDLGEFIYRNFPSNIIEGTAMAKFAKDLDLETVVVFAAGDSFASGLADIFVEAYHGKFREVVGRFEIGESMRDQYPKMVAEAKKLKADGIYVVGYEPDVAPLLVEIKKQGLDSILMGSSSVTGDLIDEVDGAAENMVFPQPNFDVTSKEPEVASFVQAYRAKYNEDPNIYAAHGYDAVYIVMRAAEIGGSTHPDDLRLGLNRLEDFKGAAGQSVFDDNGDVVRYPRIFIIRDGHAMPYETFVQDGGSLFDQG